MSRKISEIGEFGLIERIRRVLPTSPAVVVGIGDDCAVLRIFDRLMVVSCDMSVDGVHFRFDRADPSQIGWKAAASALSDIAAMGATPMFALVTLCAPKDLDVTTVEALYHGISAVMTQSGAVVVGGDTVKTDRLALDITVIGAVHGQRYLKRQGARPGDWLAVTGTVGLAAAGLHAQETGAIAPELFAAHYRPTPRIAEGQWLSANESVHAAIDISDGLLQDAGHLAAASGLAVDILTNRLVVDIKIEDYCHIHGLEPYPFLLRGGEDYELALAIDKRDALAVQEEFGQRFRTPLHLIGQFTEDGEGVRVNGTPINDGGFQHYG